MAKAVDLFAAMPAVVAYDQRRRRGQEPVEPRDDLGYSANFLWMSFGEEAVPEVVEAFNVSMILYAEHSFNASTFTGRVITSTLSDLHSAVTGAIAALKGPLHGGANEAVMTSLLAIGSLDRVEDYVRSELAAGRKLMGFGHRVYKTEDPRATHLRRLSLQMGELAGNTSWYEMSIAMERLVLEIKGLYPNVDFFAASVYHSLGIPTDLFTPVFSISRMAGRTAHVIEQHADNRLIRPDSEYIGERDQKWTPIEERG